MATTVPTPNAPMYSERCARRGERERRHDAEEVRAAGDAVKDPHVERGVRVAEPTRPSRTAPYLEVIV